jgi:hypothetical protein
MKRELAVGLLTLFAAGCDGIVGLDGPGVSDGASDVVPGDAEGGPPPHKDAAAVPAVPPGFISTWPLPDGGAAEGLAFAGIDNNSLYILETDETRGNGVALYRSSLSSSGYLGPNGLPQLASTPTLRWSSPDTGVSLSGLCAAGDSLYFGDSGGTTNEIRVINVPSDEGQPTNSAPPGVFVNIASNLPGSTLGPILGLACDRSSLFWTQSVDGTTALLRADITGGIASSLTVVFASPPGDSLHQVAMGPATVFVVGTVSGTVYAVRRAVAGDDAGAPWAIASAALPTTPLFTTAFGVYYLQGSGSSVTGQLEFVYPTRSPTGDAGSVPAYTGDPIDTFAFAGSTLLYGSSPNVYYLSQPGSSKTLVGAPGAVGGIAGATGSREWCAFYTANAITVFAVPPY